MDITLLYYQQKTGSIKITDIQENLNTKTIQICFRNTRITNQVNLKFIYQPFIITLYIV